jgi:Ankyrin repeats (3 copies)
MEAQNSLNDRLIATIRNGNIVGVMASLDEGADAGVTDRHSLNGRLIEAVKEGNIIGVMTALDEGADVNATDHLGNTVLHWVLNYCCWSESIMRLFLAIPWINVNAIDSYGHTPLYEAVEGGNKNAVSLLLAVPRTDPNIADKHGCTPLHYAVSYGNDTDITCLLLAESRTNPNTEDKLGRTPLFSAIHHGNENIIHPLLATPSLKISNKDNTLQYYINSVKERARYTFGDTETRRNKIIALLLREAVKRDYGFPDHATADAWLKLGSGSGSSAPQLWIAKLSCNHPLHKRWLSLLSRTLKLEDKGGPQNEKWWLLLDELPQELKDLISEHLLQAHQVDPKFVLSFKATFFKEPHSQDEVSMQPAVHRNVNNAI